MIRGKFEFLELIFINWLDWYKFHEFYFLFLLKFFVALFMKFRELINEQFLLYTWNSLKFDLGYDKIFEPISRAWFKKCAFLLHKTRKLKKL